MKSTIILFISFIMLSFYSHAQYMYVDTKGGMTVKFDMNHVTEIYYEEYPDATIQNGVCVSGNKGEYAFVDLLLPSGTKWATYNVGATKPTESGSFYAWGETEPKSEYSLSNYKWCDSTGYYTKYGYTIFPEVQSHGGIRYEYGGFNNSVADWNMELDAEDDAATANWGDSWRMPTTDDMHELIDACNWSWTDDFENSGVAGQIGTSKYNGNLIFLPAAQNTLTDSITCYWTSSLGHPTEGYCLEMGNGGKTIEQKLREKGLVIRAVFAE